jgi:hypothetical protein
MTQNQVDVWYRSQAMTAKPLYVSNDDVRRVAADVRGQLVSAVDGYRLTRDHLLAIERIQANGVRLEVCWSTDYPVTNEQDEAVLGVCEYDHRGMPDTALISVNPDLTRDNDGLLLGTLAHELGHAIFDVPAWRTVSCQNTLPGLLGESIHRVFRAVTTDEAHLTSSVRKAGERDFGEWRANEFMGSLLVPRDLLAARLQHHAQAMGIPLETHPAPGLLASVAAAFRLAASVDRRRSAFAISILLHRLAADFGVSLKFIQVRLLRYGLATSEQLGVASEERRSRYGPCR